MRQYRFLGLLPLAVSGCHSHISAIDPTGPAAATITQLTWLLVAVCTLVYLLTMLMLFYAVARGRRRGAAADAAPEAGSPSSERRKLRIVAAGVVATVLILSLFVAATYWTDRSLLSMERKAAAEIELTAHQWWWEIRYLDPIPSQGFVTANELHVPVGEPVQIKLISTDVIHSFWVPNLNGKRDIIPGRDGEIWLTASETGIWYGRCAEFCGFQHAHMNLLLVAEPRAAFDRWRAAQTAPARPPETPEQRRGQQVFHQTSCVLCHALRSSLASAYSPTAPDLTHLKSRRSIAAGTLPNEKGHLAGWVADPQSLKPGARMPPNMLPGPDFQALIAYLETLE
jgi:cytochrome c oxidase subunit 2